MSMPQPHAIYGQPPRDLVDIPADAVQCSPLIPGSARMMDYAPERLASAVVYAPPGTIERRYVLARMLSALAVGATLTALAPKDKGGSRLAGDLEAFGCSVHDTPRSHHRIVTTTRPSVLIGVEDAIRAGTYQQHPAHGLWTHPGVFSWDRIDEGSALLLNHLPNFHGCGADLGCGIGVLSTHVLQSPGVRALTLMDIDRRAIGCAEKNITDPRASFLWADLRKGSMPQAPLDFVVTNPPFHDHGVEDQSLGQCFITRAAAMLKKGGQLWLTANRHLPYEELLARHFSRVSKIADADGFKIIHAEK